MSVDVDANQHDEAGGNQGRQEHAVTISVNNKPVTLPRRNASGGEIKEMASVPAHETLFFLGHDGGETPVADDEVLHLSERERFETGPDGGVS